MTLVVDASVLVEFLLGSGKGRAVTSHFAEHDGALHAPELIIAETLSALRALERREFIGRERSTQASLDLVDVPLNLYPSAPLSRRVWSLRGSVTVYDAHYVALAEALDAPLITGDRKLGAAAQGLISLIYP